MVAGAANRRVLLIGIGNPDRGDDAVGIVAARLLEGRLPAEVAIITRSGDMLSLLDDWEGCEAVVCIDAAAPVGEPGRVHCLDLECDDLPPRASLAACHGLGLEHAVALGRTLARCPRHIWIYAIEGVSFEAGAPLSAAVSAALGPTLDAVVAKVEPLYDSCSSRFHC